jgi:hypothetical protein
MLIGVVIGNNGEDGCIEQGSLHFTNLAAGYDDLPYRDRIVDSHMDTSNEGEGVGAVAKSFEERKDKHSVCV